MIVTATEMQVTHHMGRCHMRVHGKQLKRLLCLYIMVTEGNK